MGMIVIQDNGLKKVIESSLNKQFDDITLEDLHRITGIAIIHGGNIIQVPWQSDGDAMNMRFPDMFYCPPIFNCNEKTDHEKLASDLKYFSHIRTLHIDIPLKNLSFLKDFKNLNELYIRECKIDDWIFLEDLINLKYLSIHESNFADLKPIGTLCKKQEEVFIVEEQKLLNGEKTRKDLIFDVPCLTNLELSKCQITDIEPLAEGKHLFDLNLSHNRISDLKPLAELERLYYLTLRWNEIEDITPLNRLKGLYYLNLRHNRIKDINIFEKFERTICIACF